MDPESLEETTNVVPDCLRAQLELSCDLLRRAPLLQQTENLALTGCEVRGRSRRVDSIVGKRPQHLSAQNQLGRRYQTF